MSGFLASLSTVVLKPTTTIVKNLGDMFSTHELSKEDEVAEERPTQQQSTQAKQQPAPFHGFLGNQEWELPRKIVHCESEARPGYNTCAAHEYEEHDAVFEEKIRLLAHMIRESSNMIAYTGAGISTSSGIGDYASRSAGKASAVAGLVASKMDWFDAKPTRAHHVLTGLYQAGYLKWWCQQNHDGLPQKAGMPQHAINEIHGAWWDPCNPVVPMSGNLRSDLFAELLAWEDRADLCLTVGTSLSGMNADRLVESCGKRALKSFKKGRTRSRSGGSVIVGYQCTRLDSIASLRIYSSIDRVMIALARELQIDIPTNPHELDQNGDAPPSDCTQTIAVGEYAHGRYLGDDVYEFDCYDPITGLRVDTTAACSQQPTIVRLNLKRGGRVMLASGERAGAIGSVTRKSRYGNYDIHFQKSQYSTRIGGWMFLSALRGEALYLPLVNTPAPQLSTR